MAVNPIPFVTPEEYLRQEREALTKSEYINGQIYAMAGASREHNIISTNVIRETSLRLRGRSCETYGSDMRVQVSETGMYTYPDVSVVCGEPHFSDDCRDSLRNPTVIFEVLSPSTEAYDRGAKFAHYQRLPSLQDYILVTQDRFRVERFTRQGDAWVYTETTDPDAVFEIASIGVSLTIRDIYDRITFPENAPSLRLPRLAD